MSRFLTRNRLASKAAAKQVLHVRTILKGQERGSRSSGIDLIPSCQREGQARTKGLNTLDVAWRSYVGFHPALMLRPRRRLALFGMVDDFLSNLLVKTSGQSVAKPLYLDQSSRGYEIGDVSDRPPKNVLSMDILPSFTPSTPVA